MVFGSRVAWRAGGRSAEAPIRLRYPGVLLSLARTCCVRLRAIDDTTGRGWLVCWMEYS